MKIALDIDDVVIDFNRGFFDFYNHKYGTHYVHENRVTYHYHTIFDISQEDAQKEYDEYTFSKFHQDTLPVGGVREALVQLRAHELFLISARPEKKREVTIRWLESHLGESLKYIQGIYLTGQHRKDKDLSKTKGEIAKDLGIDIFIEDAPSNATEIASHGIKVLLFDTPWNKNVSEHESITRVTSWDEIVEHIRSEER
jgi:uncharacterized protein